MIYVIGAVAACLGIGVGVVIGFVIAVGREARVPIDELLRWEAEALELERALRTAPSRATELQLEAVKKRLKREGEKAVAAEARSVRVQQLRVRAAVLREWI